MTISFTAMIAKMIGMMTKTTSDELCGRWVLVAMKTAYGVGGLNQGAHNQ